MLNLVIISPGFPVNEADSTCLPFLQLYLKALIAEGSVRLTVITEQYPAKENYTWHGVEVITLRKQEPAVWSKLRRNARLKSALKKLHQRQRLDVIHNFWFTRTALLAGEFAVKQHIRHLTTFSGQDVLPENKVLKHIHAYKGRLFCVSAFQAEKLKENTGVTAAVIEPGIEAVGPGEAERTIDLVFCGWINALKNYTQFVEIVAAVHAQRPLSKVVICGGGEGLPVLKEQISRVGLQTLIEVKGEIPREEVLAFMRRSKILVHTSSFESFGLVLAEALDCGCHVISKPVGIAYRHALIKSCVTTEEFTKQITACLVQATPHPAPGALYPVKQMLNTYLRIYEG